MGNPRLLIQMQTWKSLSTLISIHLSPDRDDWDIEWIESIHQLFITVSNLILIISFTKCLIKSHKKDSKLCFLCGYKLNYLFVSCSSCFRLREFIEEQGDRSRVTSDPLITENILISREVPTAVEAFKVNRPWILLMKCHFSRGDAWWLGFFFLEEIPAFPASEKWWKL